MTSAKPPTTPPAMAPALVPPLCPEEFPGDGGEDGLPVPLPELESVGARSRMTDARVASANPAAGSDDVAPPFSLGYAVSGFRLQQELATYSPPISLYITLGTLYFESSPSCVTHL